MGGHRGAARENLESSSIYLEMRNLGVENFQIILLELFPCECKSQLEVREFQIMRKLIRRGAELLNSTLEFRKHSDNTKRKISLASKGSLNHNFKRGSLRKLEDRSPRWIFQWFENGKQRSRVFSVKKYTDNGARRLAEKVQKKIYPVIKQK
jgi:hypothetical protein